KPPELDFRMNARRDLTQDLDDIPVVDDHAAVGLLAIDRIDALDLERRRAVKGRRRTEFDLLSVAADRFPGTDLAQHNRNEIRLGRCIDQSSFAGAAPDGGKDARRA